jgi:hypothetical protein
MNIDSILTEWRYRLPAGYPKTIDDFRVLQDVILEMTDVDLTEAERIVRRAMGLDEAPEDEEQSVTASTESFLDARKFEQFIMNTYSVPGQQIIGLRGMYDAIQQLPDDEKNAVLDIIRKPANLTLRTGVIPIRGSFETLYDIIRDTIKIPNGDESELWFAISYDGRVKGAVAGETGIEADIEIGDQTVSLKNYNKTTFDFGSLDAESTEQLNSFIELAKMLTGQDISKSKGREQINNILNMIDDPAVEREIQELIDMRTTTHIRMIQRIGDRLNDLLNSAEDIDSIIQSFCKNIDTLLVRKINSVSWWGMIIKPNKTLFLESSSDLYQVLKCTDDYRLSPAIANFHQNHLFVLGSQMSTQVTTKPQD